MNLRFWLRECRLHLGIGHNSTSHREKLLSALGGFIGILSICLASSFFLAIHSFEFSLLVASMGASAVLLFAVPHGALSQPWPILGGHIISAVIGVSCKKFVGGNFVSAALAVGLAIGAMYYARCIHPPGGATALTAVIAGQQIEQLGYVFVFTPVLVNTFIILLVAIVFNSCFSWRRYPAHFGRLKQSYIAPPSGNREHELTQEDFAAAMQQLDSYVDITTDGLTELLELAKQHAELNVLHPHQIQAGHFYSNGKLGKLWCIRQVIDVPNDKDNADDTLIYKNIAGDGNYRTGLCSRDEFRNWARFEVRAAKGHWIKVDRDEDKQVAI